MLTCKCYNFTGARCWNELNGDCAVAELSAAPGAILRHWHTAGTDLSILWYLADQL